VTEERQVRTHLDQWFQVPDLLRQKSPRNRNRLDGLFEVRGLTTITLLSRGLRYFLPLYSSDSFWLTFVVAVGVGAFWLSFISMIIGVVFGYWNTSSNN